MKRAMVWLALGSVVCAVLLTLAAILTGLVTYESHRGFHAPAWDADGRTVYYLERRTSGFTWGMGWEGFTGPASAYVTEDVLSVHSIHVDSGTVRKLMTVSGSPVAGRVVHHYRKSIFGYLSAAIKAGDQRLSFVATMNLPRVPSSDPWSVSGIWPETDDASIPQWSNVWANNPAFSEPVLVNGRELITTRGPAAYPAAIMLVDQDLSFRVLLKNGEFDEYYPTGVPESYITERSRREQIVKAQEFESVHARLTRQYVRDGLHDSAASIKAYDRMQEIGLLPEDPKVTAVVVSSLPPETQAFEIRFEYFEVGLFKDIAAATATPGVAVETSTGDYLKYYDDDVGVRLRNYRKDHGEFYVLVDGTYYHLTVEVAEPR